jgi:hypothetical protein
LDWGIENANQWQTELCSSTLREDAGAEESGLLGRLGWGKKLLCEGKTQKLFGLWPGETGPSGVGEEKLAGWLAGGRPLSKALIALFFFKEMHIQKGIKMEILCLLIMG